MRTRILSVIIIASIPVFNAGCSKQVSFNADVQPILNENCLKCHDGSGEGSETSGFNVQDYDSLMKGTQFGPVIVAGDSVSSTLFRMISHQADKKIQMPPHHDVSLAEGRGNPLSAAQIETVKTWIDQGAKNN